MRKCLEGKITRTRIFSPHCLHTLALTTPPPTSSPLTFKADCIKNAIIKISKLCSKQGPKRPQKLSLQKTLKIQNPPHKHRKKWRPYQILGELPNGSTNNGDMVDKDKCDVVSEWHISNYRGAQLLKRHRCIIASFSPP